MEHSYTRGDRKDRWTKTWVVAMVAAICCILWGSAIPMIKMGYGIMGIESADTASQILFAGFRFTITGVMVILFMSIRERKLMLPDATVLRLSLALSMAQTVGQYFFFYIGVAHTSGVKGGILTGFGNFLAILLSCLVFRREKMTGNKMIGCCLGFLGVVLVNVLGHSVGGGISLEGEGCLFLGMLGYALSSVMIGSFSKKRSSVMLSGYQFLIGGLILSALGWMMGGHLRMPSAVAAAVLVYLAMVSAVAYTLWSILLSHNPVSRVAIYGFINPLCSVVLSALILGETAQAFNFGTLSALLLVCAGIYIVNRPNRGAIPAKL